MCPEHTELLLIGCLTESIWNPKSEAILSTPKNQLADVLTEGNFTRDEWDHLFRLLNIMNFLMFSCCHFLSDRKQSVMSKRAQESTSKKRFGSGETGTNEFWCQGISWVRRKILRKIWVIQTAQVNQELDQSCVSSSGRKQTRAINPNPTNVFPGLTSLEILQKTQKDLQDRNVEPEKFEDRIIFMSMFKDIEWTRRGNAETCISNSEQVKNYAKRFSRGHWTFLLGPGDEKQWYGTISYTPQGKWDSIAPEIHFNADASNTELFRTMHSANQVSIYGAVSSWCGEFGLAKWERADLGKVRDRRKWAATAECETARCKFFGANSREWWSSIWKQIARMSSELRNTWRKKSNLQKFAKMRHSGKVSIRMCYKTIADVDDGLGDRTPACRGYTHLVLIEIPEFMMQFQDEL